MIRETAATAAERLRQLHPDVPPAIMPGIVQRSIIGGILVLVGVLLIAAAMYVGGRLLLGATAPTTTILVVLLVVFLTGLFLFAWGLIAASGKLLRHPLALTLATFEGAYKTIRRRKP